MLGPSAPIRRVLMTADGVGGVFTYALALAGGLARHGVGTTLATMGGPIRAEQRESALSIPLLRLRESTFRLEWMEDPWLDVELAGRWLLELEAAERPDVIHLNGYAHARAPFSSPRVVVAHSCVLSWWRAVLGDVAPARFDRYRTEVECGLAACDAVIAPTAAMLAALHENYRAVFAGRVIPNGAWGEPASAVPKEPFVLGAGRLWDRAKNVGLLDAVAPSLDWPVCLAGESSAPEVSTAGADVVRREPVGSAQRLGWLEPEVLRGWMARASVYALPARYEPFGLSALEAAAQECALVLGDIPSLREVWGDAALFLPPNDADVWRTALNSLARDPVERTRLGRMAKERSRLFRAERMADDVLALYSELAARECRSCA